MRRCLSVKLLTLLVSLWVAKFSLAAEPKTRVTFEVLTRPGLPLTASQQWSRTLGELGVAGVQIHSGGPRDEPSVTERGNRAAPEYKVVGILAADNLLYLPGGKFSTSDTARLRKWLDALADQGPQGVTEARSAFGLVAKQLEQVQLDLKRPVVFNTQGAAADQAVRQIARGLKLPLEFEPGAEAALARLKIADELQGVSGGTALAAILRPAGLVLVPGRPANGELGYRVARSKAGRESWPIGWATTRKPNEVLPDLFAFLNVEISDTPVAETVAAIQGRLKAPVLWDYNALAMHGIDPTAIKSEIPSKRMTYTATLNKVLGQAKLRYELRVDEADHPLLWITTFKPAP